MNKLFLPLLFLALSLIPGWPPQVVEAQIISAADGTMQPVLFYNPQINEPRPLLVALHTWGGDYRQAIGAPYAEWAIQHSWVFIHPNFRGPNGTPDSTGSDLVIQDILDAVNYAKAQASVSQVYLIGYSGGGHAALLIAAKHPEIFTAVSVWCPVVDLAEWYDEATDPFRATLESATGGKPGDNLAVNAEYAARSPITYLSKAFPLPLDINAGVNDTVVPAAQSMRAFYALAGPVTVGELTGANKKPLFRLESGNKRLTIFDGGHEIDYSAGLGWLAAH